MAIPGWQLIITFLHPLSSPSILKSSFNCTWFLSLLHPSLSVGLNPASAFYPHYPRTSKIIPISETIFRGELNEYIDIRCLPGCSCPMRRKQEHAFLKPQSSALPSSCPKRSCPKAGAAGLHLAALGSLQISFIFVTGSFPLWARTKL